MPMEIDPTGLLWYQQGPATDLLRTVNRIGAALDASECGVGKSYTAGAVIRALNLPTLVLCPKISVTSWLRVGEHLGTSFDAAGYEAIRTGNTPFGQWENPRPNVRPRYFQCTECQLKVELEKMFKCPHQHLGIHCLIEKVEPHDYGRFIWYDGIKLIVFDECHRVSGTDSLNADMLVAAKRQGIKVLALSATVADSPLHFRALGYALGLHQLIGKENSFWQWANRMGCRKSPFGGLAFQGNENYRRIKMAELSAQIFPSRGVRVRISELPPGSFPDVQIRAELYDLKEADRINELYAEMDDAIQQLNRLKALDKNLEHPLTKLLRARQEIELLKAPLFEQAAKDAIENGRTVGVFVNFTQTIDALAKRLKTDARIDGTQVGPAGARRRQDIIDRVQSDQERLVLLNNQAGGVSISLHDLTGQFPRLGLVSLPTSATMFKQVCGRFPRAGGKSPSLYRVVLAANTVEEKLHKRLSEKLNQLDALNDSDLFAANLPLNRFSLDQIIAREVMV